MSQIFHPLSPAKTQSLLKKIEKINANHGLHPNHVKIMAQKLSFAPSWQFIICEDFSSVPFQTKRYLTDDAKIYPIQYSNNPYQDNHFNELNLIINADTVALYVAFYYELYLSGSDRLKPVFHTDDIEWQEDLPPMIRQSLEKDFTYYPKIKTTSDGFLVIMPCIFRQSVMCVTFFVSDTGLIEIQDRTSLVDDLPIKNFS